MSDDDKNLIRDLLRSHAWKLIEAKHKQQAGCYRDLATLPPGQQPEEMRTWYAAKASGLEESVSFDVDNW